MPGYYGRSRSPRDRGLDVDTRLRVSPFGSRGRDRSRSPPRGRRDSPPPRGRSPPQRTRGFDRWSPSRERRMDNDNRRDNFGGDRQRDSFRDRRDEFRGGDDRRMDNRNNRDDWREKRNDFRGGDDRRDFGRRDNGFNRNGGDRGYNNNNRDRTFGGGYNNNRRGGFNDRRGGFNDRRDGGGRYGQTYRSRFSLLITNIDDDVDWRELKDVARKFGEVTYTDCNKLKRNEGIVTYATEGDMHNAFREMANHDLRGRAIRLEYEFPEHEGAVASGDRSRSRSR